jgi:gamma-glutamyltranspeptidase/glutathione hydrolase
LLFLVAALSSACDGRVSQPAKPTAPEPPAHSLAASAAPSAARPAASQPVPEVELAAGGSHAVSGARGVVSSEDAEATRIGVAVLESGGNAVDAAVAVGYALSVTHHVAGSLGGGGFMIVRLATGETHAIDYREIAPKKATVALNEKQLRGGAHGYLSAPVPGVVAGLNLARERFGSRPLAELLGPSIALAREGHGYSERQALVLGWYWDRLKKDPVARAIFGTGPGKERPIGAGYRLRQPRLAETLEAIAAGGDAAFYRGAIAERLAKAMEKNGGIVTAEDLAGYRAVVRPPLSLVYRGFVVHTMPPPSMGGVALAAILLNLDALDAERAAPGSADSSHLFIEAARRGYADRRAVGADPAFVDRALVDPLLGRIVDPGYHRARAPAVDRSRATPSLALKPLGGTVSQGESSGETTHFSVVDGAGNAVACTTTLSAAFGAHVIVPETGVILSNAMGAFSPSGVNALAPGKRMASSMTPTLLVASGRTVAVLGTPGGDTIPGTVAQVVRNLVDYRMTIDQAIDAGRVHQQYLPDTVRYETERAPAPGVRRELERRGHKLQASSIPLGDLNGIVVDAKKGVAWGFADARKGGLALAAGEPK